MFSLTSNSQKSAKKEKQETASIRIKQNFTRRTRFKPEEEAYTTHT